MQYVWGGWPCKVCWIEAHTEQAQNAPCFQECLGLLAGGSGHPLLSRSVWQLHLHAACTPGMPLISWPQVKYRARKGESLLFLVHSAPDSAIWASRTHHAWQ